MKVQEEVLGEEISKRVREVMDGKQPDFSFTLPAGAIENCAWCNHPFAFGRLYDGEVVAFELETWDGEQRVNFARPHVCKAEPNEPSPEESFLRELAAVEADEQDAVATAEEIAANARACAALRARFAKAGTV
jgi:hypothetical protein